MFTTEMNFIQKCYRGNVRKEWGSEMITEETFSSNHDLGYEFSLQYRFPQRKNNLDSS